MLQSRGFREEGGIWPNVIHALPASFLQSPSSCPADIFGGKYGADYYLAGKMSHTCQILLKVVADAALAKNAAK